jgi:pyruvate formate lyase activating enzyme
MMKEAPIYNKLSESRVQCQICPRFCMLGLGQRGFCGLYVNDCGRLFIEEYGALIGCYPTNYGNMLFHPAEYLLTVQLPGCNLGCKFCGYGKRYTGAKIENVQPYHERQPFVVIEGHDPVTRELTMPKSFRRVSPRQIVEIMTTWRSPLATECCGLDFSAVEPAISLSWVCESAQLCHESGRVNHLSTSGFLSRQTTEQLSKCIDSVRLSFKSSGDKEFYRVQVNADSEHVFNCAKTFKENGVFLQIVNSFEVGAPLDNFRQWTRWVVENLGADTPVAAEPIRPFFGGADEYFVRIEQIAREEGLRFFLLDKPKTFRVSFSWKCPECQNPILTEELSFSTSSRDLGVELFDETFGYLKPIPIILLTSNVDSQGRCMKCGCQTPIIP